MCFDQTDTMYRPMEDIVTTVCEGIVSGRSLKIEENDFHEIRKFGWKFLFIRIENSPESLKMNGKWNENENTRKSLNIFLHCTVIEQSDENQDVYVKFMKRRGANLSRPTNSNRDVCWISLNHILCVIDAPNVCGRGGRQYKLSRMTMEKIMASLPKYLIVLMHETANRIWQLLFGLNDFGWLWE